MQLAPLHCPICGSAIPGAEVHLELAVARCVTCTAVFDLGGRRSEGLLQPAPAPRAQVPLPAGFQVEDSRHSGLTVSWRWFTPLSIFLAIFCVGWDGFLVLWYSVALGEDAPLVMSLFPLIHVAVGLGLTYWTLATFVNRTTLQVTHARLTVQHGPLPARANLQFSGGELTQLYGMEHRHRGKNGVSISYSLNGIDHRKRQRKLLTGLTKLEQVLWLEQALERHLRLKDQPVEGEVARRSA